MAKENYINHIALVLDSSGSMQGLSKQVVQVADNQIEYLAQRSKELDQETRATVYTFDSTAKCVFYDKDVLRMPSLAQSYRAQGQTALLDATVKAIEDLRQTPELYGDHAFLIFVLTDGQENASKLFKGERFRDIVNSLPPHWTLAVLVPDQRGVHEAKGFGFPVNNISVWNPTEKGIIEVGERIRKATDDFMLARSKGIKSFAGGIFHIDLSNVNVAALVPLFNVREFEVSKDARIDEYIGSFVGHYSRGMGYYQLTKKETIQPNKSIIIKDKATGLFYGGANARKMLNLPDTHVDVLPTHDARYIIFVQSTSDNRKLLHGTLVLVV